MERIVKQKLSEYELIAWAMKKSNRKSRETAALFDCSIQRIKPIREKVARKLKKHLQEGGSEEEFIAPSLPCWGCSSIEELLDKARDLVLPLHPPPTIPWSETEEGRKQAARTEKIQAEIEAARRQALLPTIFDTTGNKLNFRE
jgi:hypothetical protein